MGWFGRLLTKKPPAVPSFCLLVVHKQCNFRCTMCHMWKSQADPQALTFDEMRRCVDELRTFVSEPIFIHLIGGETLLWPHTAELAKYITESGFKTSITTNGYLVDHAMAAQLVDARVSGVFLSLDSLDEATHDTIRGVRGAWQHVMNAIDYLHEANEAAGRTGEHRTTTGITFTLMGRNAGELMRMAAWAEAHPRIDSLFVNGVLRPFDCGSESREWMHDSPYTDVWPKDLDSLDRALDELATRRRCGSKLCNPPEQLAILKEYFHAPYQFRQNLSLACPRGEHALEINARGDVALCFYMPPLGNVRKRSLKSIWMSKERQHMSDAMCRCDKECDLVVNCFYKLEKGDSL